MVEKILKDERSNYRLVVEYLTDEKLFEAKIQVNSGKGRWLNFIVGETVSGYGKTLALAVSDLELRIEADK